MAENTQAATVKYCKCGCGAATKVVRANYPDRGLKPGDYYDYIGGHRNAHRAQDQKSFDVDAETGCHVWSRSINAKGYATLGGAWWKKTGRSILAHRIAWEDANDRTVPDGWTVDHLCRNRACVNPEHLEAVPHKINVRRGTKTKLTAEQVDAIRRETLILGRTAQSVADEFGVSRSQVSGISNGATWAA